jgi:hypothetical protein
LPYALLRAGKLTHPGARFLRLTGQEVNLRLKVFFRAWAESKPENSGASCGDFRLVAYRRQSG